MAIYHLSMKPVSRTKGRSAVASMAYRAGEKLTNERDGITHDYTAKQGVEHAEIVLPQGVSADWARDRSDLWNAAEFAEKRKDARVAREFEIALPHELSAEQRLEVTREFAQELANRYGAAVDFAIHAPHDASDVRNHHAHVMMTTRQVTEDGLGDKTYLERENKWLLANDLPTTDMQLRDLRQRWEGSPMSGWRWPGLIFASTIVRTWSAGLRSRRPSIWASMPRRWSGAASTCRGRGWTRMRPGAMPS